MIPGGSTRLCDVADVVERSLEVGAIGGTCGIELRLGIPSVAVTVLEDDAFVVLIALIATE